MHMINYITIMHMINSITTKRKLKTSYSRGQNLIIMVVASHESIFFDCRKNYCVYWPSLMTIPCNEPAKSTIVIFLSNYFAGIWDKYSILQSTNVSAVQYVTWGMMLFLPIPVSCGEHCYYHCNTLRVSFVITRSPRLEAITQLNNVGDSSWCYLWLRSLSQLVTVLASTLVSLRDNDFRACASASAGVYW